MSFLELSDDIKLTVFNTPHHINNTVPISHSQDKSPIKGEYQPTMVQIRIAPYTSASTSKV